jgi:folate-binding protein YgfZ
MVSESVPDAPGGYDAARSGAGLIERADRRRMLVSGRDRASYLQGLLTNDIAGLTAGTGCYAAYLTPQGRMIADLWVYELGDGILLSMIPDVKDTVLSKLDQFIFSEDVQLTDLSDTSASLAIVGPLAARVVGDVLESTDSDTLAALPEHGSLNARAQGHPVIVLRVSDLGVDGYELVARPNQLAALEAALSAKGAQTVTAAAIEALRIEAGLPRFHRDMDETTIPLEAGIESRAISQTKGCYVGQEVIARVLHRGHGRVVKKLVGLAVEGARVPAPTTTVDVDGRDAGSVTSSVYSPSLRKPIALAYVHRDFTAPGTVVTLDGEVATVTALPFVA